MRKKRIVLYPCSVMYWVFVGGGITYDKTHCWKCAGSGEVDTDCYNEPPEPCDICGGREALLDEIKQHQNMADEWMRCHYKEAQ